MQMFYKSARVEYHPVGVVSDATDFLALHCCRPVLLACFGGFPSCLDLILQLSLIH